MVMTPAERFPVIGTAQGLIESLKPHYGRALFCTAFGSAASILFSIAISQILLGIGLLLLTLGRPALNFPAIKLPLALFFIATILADLFSGNPQAGIPQIKKFYVFGIVVLISCAFRTVAQFTTLLISWVAISVLSAAAGFAHVLARRQHAVQLKWITDYDYYLDDRIRGFANHWMTFGAEQMIVLLMLLSFLLFACPKRWRIPAWSCAAILWISLMLGLTRSIFLLGVPLGVLYLLCAFKPWTLALIPILAIASYIVMPFQVRERVWSVVSPHGEMDSNSFRSVTRRTGWEMVKRHPWFGLGPEEIRPSFESYVPPGIPRPLPPGWYGHLHNIYLQYAAERGIPALCFLLWMIGKMVIDFAWALRSGDVPQQHRYILHGAIAVVIAILAAGFFEYNLGDSEVLTMFLAVTTAACATIRMDRETCS
jgi:putative inorganic carbon (HCO3(-)) transporter